MSRNDLLFDAESEKLPGRDADRNTSFSGLLAVLAAITMLFAAFSSAYIVRRGISTDWTPLRPSALRWLSAITLLLSSTILEWGERHLPRRRAYRFIVAAFGLAACVILIQSWRGLPPEGEFPAASPAVAFVSIFTGAFLLCLIAGIIAILRANARGDSSTLYWHYLAGLWIALAMFFQVWP